MKTIEFSGDNIAVLRPELMSKSPPTAAMDTEEAYQKLLAVCAALSAEHDRDALLNMIVENAVAVTGADAGGLYLCDADGNLQPAVVRWRDAYPMKQEGGRAGRFPPVTLHLPPATATGDAIAGSHGMVSGCGISLADDSRHAGDQTTEYGSVSFLTVPLSSPSGEQLGVLHLVNAATSDGSIVPFEESLRPAVVALASQAAVALENQRLIEEQYGLFESLVRMLAAAIDAKSPYTGAHCQRVPVIYELLADAACTATDGPFAQFELSDDERRELRLAAWLHDCGKVATPEHVVDKATKLECVYDRLDEIAVRFEVLKRDEEIVCLENIIRDPGNAEQHRRRYYEQLRQLDAEFEVLAAANQGEEPMSDEMIARVREIATRRWRDREGLSRPLLDAGEVTNLSIRQGTLNQDERQTINRHVEISIEMLGELPFPKTLSRVTEIAGAHHEKIDGSGYPYGLTGEQMSVPARMLVIADIFEALTAGDRPYKRGKTLREALQLMAAMRDENKIDAELFELFVSSRVWQTYAEYYMPAELRDGVDIKSLLRRPGAERPADRAAAS